MIFNIGDEVTSSHSAQNHLGVGTIVNESLNYTPGTVYIVLFPANGSSHNIHFKYLTLQKISGRYTCPVCNKQTCETIDCG